MVDLSKAFDAVNYSILLGKLASYCVELKWFKNGRKRSV